MGKMDQIGMKRGKIEEKILGKFGRKVQKVRKKPKNPKFNKCTGSNNHAGWIFFLPKTINAQYLISMHRVDFFPKSISAQCASIRDCRVLLSKILNNTV